MALNFNCSDVVEQIDALVKDVEAFSSAADVFINSIKIKQQFNIIEYTKHRNKYNKFVKVKLGRNSKVAAKGTHWREKTYQTRHAINGNYGIITGPTNNIIVLDVDNKDKIDKKLKMHLNHGIEEFKKYTSEFGEPDTMKITTPGGGFHLYFNYKGSNEEDNYLIKNYLTNKSGYRSSCLDIRSEGGYIVGRGSKIDGKEYSLLNNNYKINDMPRSLINFLLASQNIETKIKKVKEPKQVEINIKSNNSLNWVITDEQIYKILNALDNKYLNNYDDWLKATTALKSLNKFDIWDKWSQQSGHYDKTKNYQQWGYNKGVIDINFLIHEIKKTRKDVKFELVNK